MVATKDQEHKALEKIKGIVEELGENSYIATAFEGCFEIAEKNIENDFADSYKDRYENAINELNKANKEIATFKKTVEEMKNNTQSLKNQVEDFQSRLIGEEDLKDIELIINEKITSIQNEIQSQSETIVLLAENPENDEFKQAVKSHRTSLGLLKYTENLKKGVHDIYTKSRAYHYY